MSRSPELYQWRAEIAKHFSHLSQPMVMGLALWSLGMILVRSCSLTAIAAWWSCRLDQPFQTVRERLRDTYRDAEAKAGAHRTELDLRSCWAPWLAWVLAGWSGTQLAVALDATTLGQRFVLLVISVLYRGCAVPIVWKVLPATRKHPWKPEWLALLKTLRGSVPPTWTVLVLADRGLYAKWLFEAIQALGWHPLLRVNAGGTFRPAGWHHRYPLTHWTPTVGSRWQGRGTAFAGKKPPGLHPAGLLGCRPSRAVVAPDRLPPPSRRGLLVRVARLDRARLQKDQGRRLAMALYPDDRSRPGSTPLVGSRPRHLVGARRGRRSRSPPPGRHVSIGAGFAPATRPALAVSRHLPARLVVDRGRTFQS